MRNTSLLTRTLNIVLALTLSVSLAAQDFLGFPLGNFSGVNAMLLNPAEIADNRMAVDINLLSGSLAFDNNFVGVNNRGFFATRVINDEYEDYRDFRNTNFNDGFENVEDVFASKDKRIYIGVDLLGPSFMFQLKDGSAFGLHSRLRNMINVDGFAPEAAKLALEGLSFQPLWIADSFERFETDGFSIDAMHWAEFGLTYARILPIAEDRPDHFFKGGLTLKLLQGYASAYVAGIDANYSFVDDDTLNITLSDFQWGHTTNYEVKPLSLFNSGFQGSGFGFDLGIVYEYRPDHETFWVETKEGTKPKKDHNKYKVKGSLSLLDVGGIKFNKDPETYDLADVDTFLWDLTDIKLRSIQSFDSLVNVTFPQSEFGDPNNKTTYRMGTPLAVALNVDYMVNQRIYLNFGAFLHPALYKNLNKVHGITNINFTPRLESKWYDLGLPFSYSVLGHFDVGLYFRLGPFFIGSPDFLRNAFGKTIKSFKLYGGIKVPIHQPTIPEPGDLDKDGVLDFADDCIDVPGPIENNGCPYGDRDQDGVMDNADECIDVPGPIENNGCPYADLDGDGVLDAADKCIDVPGPIENNGCPYADLDGDGVFDEIDECIDVPGPKENNGCPWGDKDKDGVLDKDDECIDLPGPAENKGCPYADTDGDSLQDLEDDCPLTPGPISNRGCPEIDTTEQEIVRLAFENLEFEYDKAIIRPSSYASLNELASLLVRKPNYGLKLAGHTDSDGSEEYNLILSKNRAEAVKTYLVGKGANAEKIVTEYYGESMPIASNDTPQGKQRNRRVEMTLIVD